MTVSDAIALLPEILLAATSLAILLLIAINRNHAAIFACTIAGLSISFVSLWVAADVAPREIAALLVVDTYALFYSGFLIVASIAVVLLAYSYLESRNEHREEFYALIVLATFGTVVLASATHFVTLFLGIEILSVSLYALVSYLREQRLPLEAGVKYLVLAATSSAFLLFGLALLYAQTGSMRLAVISRALMEPARGSQAGLELAGIVLVLTGFGFKLASVPFHLWTPDVYEGAPLPVTAFVASVSKGGVFAVLLRWFQSVASNGHSPAWWVFITMAVASMLVGNLLALQQSNIKRLLAYSSIGNMGYLLLAFLSMGPFGVAAGTYYLVAYAVTIIGAFGCLSLVSPEGEEQCEIDSLRGLFWSRPLLASLFSLMLLSLAGIPLTAGFLGKVYIVSAAASTPLWMPILILVVSSTIGVYYYLRVLVAFFSPLGEQVNARPARLSRQAMFSVTALAVLVVLLGVYPTPLWTIIQRIAHVG